MEANIKTIKEFIEKYRMSRRTYYRRLKRGQVPAGVKIGRTVFIEAHDEDEWLRTVRGVSRGREERGPI